MSDSSFLAFLVPQYLGPLMLISELCLARGRFAPSHQSGRRDRGSLIGFWIVVAGGATAAAFLPRWVPTLNYELASGARVALAVAFLLGVLFRWWSVLTLGRMFTINVALVDQHRLVEHGPYRWLRHPSYSGALLAVLALAALYENWASLGLFSVAFSAVLLYRIHVEERSLLEAFGAEYEKFCKGRSRLVPGVY